MFNIGFTELIILGVIALLVIGPEQLPDLARKIAKILNELKRAKDEIMAPLDDLKAETQVAIQKFRQDIEAQSAKIEEKIKNPVADQQQATAESVSTDKKES